MHVFYIFDVSKCTEKEDIGNAILYFHPPEISKEELYTLCSQLVGMVQFLQATFSAPLVLKLGARSFSFKKIHNYLLVLGSNDTNGLLLKKQLGLLISIFSFYYGDFSKFQEEFCHDLTQFRSFVHASWDHCFQMAKSSLVNGISTPVIKQIASKVHVQSCHLLDAYNKWSNLIGSALISKHVLLLTDMLRHFAVYLILLHDCDKLIQSDVLIPCALPADVSLKHVYLNFGEASNAEIASSNNIDVNSLLRSCSYYSFTTAAAAEEEDGGSQLSNRLSLLMLPSCTTEDFSLRPVHVLCHYHSSSSSSSFSSNKACEERFSCKGSTCEFEFQCFLCQGVFPSHMLRSYHHRYVGISDVSFLERTSSSTGEMMHSMGSKNRRKRRGYHKVFCTNLIRKYFNQTFQNESMDLPKQLPECYSDFFEQPDIVYKKSVLYLHKFKESSLFLLVETCPTQDELYFMWCCSLAALMSLEFHTAQHIEKPHHSSENILAVFHTGSRIFFGNHMIDSMQSIIHTDFLAHELFRSIYLGKYDKSFYACSNRKFQLFYEQLEASNQKPSWIMQMYKKAHHKAKKYFNM